MGGTQSLPPEQLSELLEITKFKKKDLKRWYKKFIKDYPDGQLDIKRFHELYGRIYRTNFSNHLAEHIFNSLDQDNDGYVSFKELMSAISVTTHGTPHAKLEWLFNVYDLDGNGVISLDEVKHMIKCMLALSHRRPAVVTCTTNHGETVTSEQIEEMFKVIDLDCNGYWSLEEFEIGILRHPEFVRILKLKGDRSRDVTHPDKSK